MQLLEHGLQLLRDRKSQMPGILQKAYALIGEIKKITAVLSTDPVPMMCISNMWPIPTRRKIRIFRQIPLKPISEDSLWSAIAHMTPVI